MVGRHLDARAIGVAALAFAFALGCAEGGGIQPLRPNPPAPDAPLDLDEAAARYATLCAGCHGELGEGGLAPALVDLDVEESALAATIEATMPAGEPERCTGGCAIGIARFVLERLTSDALRCDAVPPGPRRLRMLNRREYANSVRDLLGLDDAAPAPAEPSCPPTTFVYDPGGRSLTSVHVAGTFNGWDPGAWPMALDGGVWRLTRALPVGTHEYKLVLNGGEWIADPTNPETTDDTYGGRNSVLRVDCDATAAPEPAPGGLDLVGAFPIEPRPEGYDYDNSAEAIRMTSIHLDELMRSAERAVDHLGEAGIDRLAACGGDGREACVARFVRDFGRRAFRRPIEADEAARYEAIARDAPDRRQAIGAVIRGMLVSPQFLYRSELGEPVGDGTYRLTGWEIATALAYTLWATTPDAALLDAAAAGALDDDAEIERQARRLLDDPRSRAPVAAFVRQWLGVEAVLDATKVDPRFDGALARAMVEETERFALHVIFDGSGRYDELLTADYTFVDARLAALYGMDAPSDAGFARAPYPDGRRGGLIGHASVLASTAHSDQSSPIRRGLFVRRRLLCQEFPPPPANAGGVPDVDPTATTRERFRQHTENAACASCHQYIDPIGFGLEPFDPIGAWRETENGHPIERGGHLNDVEGFGTDTEAPFETVPELASILVESEAAPACFARQVRRYVRGATETPVDRCAVQDLAARFEASGRDVRALFVATFTSPEMRVRVDGSGEER